MAVSEQEFGVALGRLGSVEKTVDRLERKLDENTQHTAEILRKLSAAEGGWKMLAGVAAAGATIGGLIVKFIPFGLLK